MSNHIAENLHTLKQTILHTSSRLKRQDSVTLLAVSKTKPLQDIITAWQHGQLHFGENYVQESVDKITQFQLWRDGLLDSPDVPYTTDYPQAARSELPIWHFIGAIQSNKTAHIASHFDWVHTVSREKIAKRLSEQRPSHLKPLQICIQINSDEGDNKAGIAATDDNGLLSLACLIYELPNIELRGLMHIPEPDDASEVMQKKHVYLAERLTWLRTKLQQKQLNTDLLDTLSMGMSSDLVPAIAAGSTMVRIGTALFGARE